MNASHTFSFWRIINYTPDLSEAEVETALEKAFKLWSRVSPLNFTKTSQEEADIKIAFLQGGRLKAVMLDFAFPG